MRGLNPDHLRALSEVIAQGSFTRAAKRLNLAQPTISLQIRELEMRLGVRLVERLGKRAYPTAAGRELLEHAEKIAQETERLLAAMRRHRDGWLGRVRIGSSTTALIYHLPPVLEDLRKRHPNIELVVTTGTTSGVVERILRNEIDLGVVSLPISEKILDIVPLKAEPLVAIFPARTRQAAGARHTAVPAKASAGARICARACPGAHHRMAVRRRWRAAARHGARQPRGREAHGRLGLGRVHRAGGRHCGTDRSHEPGFRAPWSPL